MGLMATLRDWFGPIDATTAPRDMTSVTPLDMRAALSDLVPGWISGKPSWPSDSVIVLTRDGYRKCVTAFACINIIADAVAEATLRVWLDEGSGKRDEISDHPLRQLMQHPNPKMSEAEFLADVVRIAAITGYSVIEKVRAQRRNVVQLGILRPDYVKPILRDQRPPDWEYVVPGEPRAVLPSEDAVVFTYMGSPTLDVTGDTPMRQVMREAGILNELTDFVKLLLERGGMPQIALVVDTPKEGDVPQTLSPEERELIRQQFIAKYSGYRNWAGPAIVEGMRVEQIGFDLNQMAFKDLRDSIDLDVCSAFRVPPPLVQVMAGLTTSYGKTLEESQNVLQQYTANPLRTRLDGALTRGLLPEFDVRPNIDLGFDTSTVKALQEDEDAVHTRAREDLKSGGITLDEFRQRIGEEALENQLGRSLMIPFSMVLVPSDRPDTPAEPKPTETPPPADDPDDDEEEQRRLRAEYEQRVKQNGQFPTLTPLYYFRGDQKYLNERALTDVQRRAIEQVKQHNTEQIVRLADLVAPKVADYLQAQKQRVIAALVGAERGYTDWFTQRELQQAQHPERMVATRAIEEIDWASEEESLLAILRSWLDTVGETAFADAALLLDSDLVWNVSNPYLGDLLDVLGQRVTGITETTRADIERVVVEALVEGTTMPELADALRGLYEETYAGRSATIARTESMVAYGHASTAAYRASGVVAEVQVLDNPSHSESYAGAADGLTCASRHNLVVPLDRGMFHVQSDHPNGSASLSPIVQPVEGE